MTDGLTYVRMLSDWIGVTFAWRAGECLWIPAGDAERLIAGGVCEAAEPPAEFTLTEPNEET